MTNQLITYRLPIDYSLISLMSSISYAYILRKPRRDFRLLTSDFRLPTSEEVVSRSEVGSRNSGVRSQESEVPPWLS